MARSVSTTFRSVARGVAFLFFGFRRSSSLGSTLRRISSRLTFLIIIVLSIESYQSAALDEDQLSQLYTFTLFWSVAFFCLTVASVIYLGGTSNAFRPAPLRLIVDVMLSSIVSVLGFALMYRHIGLLDTRDWSAIAGKGDFLYFSAVTFSTLGYGDFRAVEGARLWAALQAVYGNVHLGLLAGAVFFALNRSVTHRPHDGSEKQYEPEPDGAGSANNIRD